MGEKMEIGPILSLGQKVRVASFLQCASTLHETRLIGCGMKFCMRNWGQTREKRFWSGRYGRKDGNWPNIVTRTKSPSGVISAMCVHITRNQAHWMRHEILHEKLGSNWRKTLLVRE